MSIVLSILDSFYREAWLKWLLSADISVYDDNRVKTSNIDILYFQILIH